MSTRNLLPAPELVHDAENVDEENDLRERVVDLEGEVRSLRSNLNQLAEVVRSARIVFGGAPSQPAASTPASDRWTRMKEKLGGKQAEVIQALIDHGAATRSQLRVITGSGMSTIDGITAKLRDMGLIVKNGDTWKLKD